MNIALIAAIFNALIGIINSIINYVKLSPDETGKFKKIFTPISIFFLLSAVVALVIWGINKSNITTKTVNKDTSITSEVVAKSVNTDASITSAVVTKSVSSVVTEITTIREITTVQESTEKPTEILLSDINPNPLCRGEVYQIYTGADSSTFLIGSKEYKKGFAIGIEHTQWGPILGEKGNGYVIFDLEGKYSKFTFDIGKINGYADDSVFLKIYIDNEYIEQYEFDGLSISDSLVINLNYAKELRLELVSDEQITTAYGFFNSILYY
ncbi:MAG: hypothetical protein LBM93_09270 [Oscillospiraceae bacterium]|nr:hypothetical protein [Oscillospiraceae bacterium]